MQSRIHAGLASLLLTITSACGDDASGDESGGSTTSTTTASTTDTSPTVTTDTTSTTDPSTTDASSSESGTGACMPGLEEGCSCDAGACTDPLICIEGTCEDTGLMHARAPDDRTFMYQNIQTEFEFLSGARCTGRVTAAMATGAMCFVGSDNELKCAGRVYQTVFGNEFVGTGEMDVEQVMIRATFNMPEGNGMCVLRSGEIHCMGQGYTAGFYGTGDTNSLPQFTQWGSLSNVVRMGTGDWAQICGLTDTGEVHCAGFNYGLSPGLVASNVQQFYVNDLGAVVANDNNFWRAASARTSCLVWPSGLTCNENFGMAGAVVDGGTVDIDGDVGVCWLTNLGDVVCDGLPETNYFPGNQVIALAYNYRTSSMCAVYNDGSLWCIGANDEGKLGTGDQLDLAEETQVQPPGSVRIECTG